MKTFNYWWKFTGCRDYHEAGTIQARNLPEALEKLIYNQDFRLSGQTLKRHRNRRIHFYGRCACSGIGIPAPLVEGIVANA
jgi:hypothetical protein